MTPISNHNYNNQTYMHSSREVLFFCQFIIIFVQLTKKYSMHLLASQNKIPYIITLKIMSVCVGMYVFVP